MLLGDVGTDDDVSQKQRKLENIAKICGEERYNYWKKAVISMTNSGNIWKGKMILSPMLLENMLRSFLSIIEAKLYEEFRKWMRYFGDSDQKEYLDANGME
jgi:hypothetical protein